MLRTKSFSLSLRPKKNTGEEQIQRVRMHEVADRKTSANDTLNFLRRKDENEGPCTLRIRLSKKGYASDLFLSNEQKYRFGCVRYPVIAMEGYRRQSNTGNHDEGYTRHPEVWNEKKTSS